MSETNGLMTRDAILARKPRRFANVEIEGWGKFRIRSLTELERSQFEASIRDKSTGQLSARKMLDVKCLAIVLCVVDGNGDPILQRADIESLREQDSSLTNQLFDAIQAHCGGGETVEGLEKNSAPTSDATSQ